MNGSTKSGSSWSRLHARINRVADHLFYRLGYWVATHAQRTLLISLVLVTLCCLGFANFTIEEDGRKLWVPADSLSKRQETIILDTFADASDKYGAVLLEHESETGNLLTKQGIDSLWELNAIITTIETGGKTYADLCAKALDGVTCEQSFRGVTRFWGDFEAYEASVSSDADVLTAVNVANFPDGLPVNHQALFGNAVQYDAAGNVSGARAMIQAYGLDSDPGESAAINEEVLEWNADFQDTIGEMAPDFADDLNVFYFTSRSTDDALAESVSGEVLLFIITYIVMVVFVTITLARCCSGAVQRRSLLGVGGIFLVVAAGLAAYGINSAFRIPFTSLSQILPFILVGIGVDDMFVIVASFDHTDSSLPVEERIALGVKRCGVSITYTSFTNFFAFLLGSMSVLPAVQYFCLYASTAILFDFFLQMTAFVALLTMDARRQQAGRIDLFCCFKTSQQAQGDSQKRAAEAKTGTTMEMTTEMNAVESKTSNGVGTKVDEIDSGKVTGWHQGVQQRQHQYKLQPHVATDDVHELTALGRFMKDKYSPRLLSAPGKLLVLFASALLLTAGIYGVTQATTGFDMLDLMPDDHFARDYTEHAREYEVELSEWYVPLGIYTEDVDYPDVAVQAEIQATDELMLEQQFVVGPLGSWLSSFVAWAQNSTQYSANVGMSGGYPTYENRNTFYTALSDFIQYGTNSRFSSDIVFDDDGTIEISRSEVFLIDLSDQTKSVKALEDTRDVVDQSTLDPQPFGFAQVFVFTEQSFVIYNELISSFGLALAAVLVLSLLVLGKVGVVVLVCLTVLVIDVELLGFVYHWGLDVNSITVIELVMAVGLVIDYMVHIVHYFLHQDPHTPKDVRIANALGEIGPSVMVGAATTFLGIMPLAFASNVIFRVFFKMFLVIISFGFFHGIAFVPVMLSILPDRLVTQRLVNHGGEAVAGGESKLENEKDTPELGLGEGAVST